MTIGAAQVNDRPSRPGEFNYNEEQAAAEEAAKIDLADLDGGLTLLQYQLAAHNTAIYPEHGTGSVRALSYLMALIASEAGEVNGKWSKYLRDGTAGEELRQAIFEELGDTLWAIALIADEMDESLETIANINIKKLASRQERGVLGGSGDRR